MRHIGRAISSDTGRLCSRVLPLRACHGGLPRDDLRVARIVVAQLLPIRLTYRLLDWSWTRRQSHRLFHSTFLWPSSAERGGETPNGLCILLHNHLDRFGVHFKRHRPEADEVRMGQNLFEHGEEDRRNRRGMGVDPFRKPLSPFWLTNRLMAGQPRYVDFDDPLQRKFVEKFLERIVQEISVGRRQYSDRPSRGARCPARDRRAPTL